jgi:hypothetical protein
MADQSHWYAISIRLMPDTLELVESYSKKHSYTRTQGIESLIHAGLVSIGQVCPNYRFQPRPGMGPKLGHKFTERTLLSKKKKLAKPKS